MNEAMAIFLKIDAKESEENRTLIKKIDALLLTHGVEYTRIRNLYKAIDYENREHVLFAAKRALMSESWLRDRLAAVSIVNRTNVCAMDEIKLDHMSEPSFRKMKYYEDYYHSSCSLAHGIVVDENRQLRDGYISYLIARKQGLIPDIYEAFANQPIRKIVRGRHVCLETGIWRIKNDVLYSWQYRLRKPVAPGDILKVETRKGDAFICAEQIDYTAGREFCREHFKVKGHMGTRLQE